MPQKGPNIVLNGKFPQLYGFLGSCLIKTNGFLTRLNIPCRPSELQYMNIYIKTHRTFVKYILLCAFSPKAAALAVARKKRG